MTPFTNPTDFTPDATPLTVVYDACVLFPAPLRDFLMHLALTGLFRAKWSEAIHAEWMRNVLAKRPELSPAALERTRQLMDHHVLEALVSGYEPLIETLTLPDPDDRHVLAAALHSGASVIVTFNLGDFPATVLKPHGLKAQHPDAFMAGLYAENSDVVCLAARRQRQLLLKPPKTVEEYLATLEAQGLPQTVALLRQREEFL